MGLGYIYFVVLSPTGIQVIVEPYDPVYVTHLDGRSCPSSRSFDRTGARFRPPGTQSLLPALVDFWHNHVLPAFEERDRVGVESVGMGWIPADATSAGGRKRTAAALE
jgi:hypothetical protein